MLKTIRRVALGFSLYAGSALAADRTVCFEINLLDARDDCGDATETGTTTNDYRACNPDDGNAGTTTDGKAETMGFRYQLWDKDGSAATDDLISTFWLSGTGVRCATFAWEGQSYQTGDNEANPDVYIKLLPQVRGSSSGVILKALDGAGVDHPTVSFRDGTPTADEFVAVNCATGSNCYIDGGTPLIPTTGLTSTPTIVFEALDSAQRTMRVFDTSINGTSAIEMYVDLKASLPCNCDGGANSETMFQVSTTRADEGDTPCHEAGHVLQMREFGLDDLRSDLGGNGWGPLTIETNSGATTEGWALYVALVSWYDPSTASADPEYNEVGYETPDIMGAGNTCTDAPDIPAQVAKAFWDLDDVTDDVSSSGTGNDTNNLSTAFILNQWSDFADGTSNRQDYEDDVGEENGVNMWDYRFNAPIGDENTFIHHNCLTGQDTN